MYIKKLDLELSSLIFYVFMYVVSCRDAEFTFPGLMVDGARKIMADAGRHQAGKIIASQSIINSHRTSIGQSTVTVTQKSTVTH